MWLNYIIVLHLNHVCPPNVTEICTRVPVTYVPTWSMVGCKTRMSNASGFSLQGLHLLWLPSLKQEDWDNATAAREAVHP